MTKTYCFIGKNLSSICSLIIISLLLTGCGAGSAINRTANYSYAWPSISYSADKDITVGVIDKRPYVTNGKIKESYVGLMRGGFGNPWYMHTESGKALSEDILRAVKSGFMNANIAVSSVALSPNMGKQETVDKLRTKDSYRKILITVNEWKSDTYRTTRFLYDLSAEVYDREGHLLSEHKEENTSDEEANQSVESPVDAGREVLSQLLNNNAIVSSL
jgi:hypothetical protein